MSNINPPIICDAVDLAIAETGISLRTQNTLENHGILYVRELLQCCGKLSGCSNCAACVGGVRRCGCTIRLLDLPNFGVKTLNDVYNALSELGLHKGRKYEQN